MATKQEKSLIGLNDEATQEQYEQRLRDLVAAEQLLNEGGGVRHKVVMISLTGQMRPRGTYEIPPVVPGVRPEPIVKYLDQIDPLDLAEAERDDRVLVLRTDTPVTPEASIRRYKRASS